MPSFLTRQFRAFIPMFRPPFDGLWIAGLLYYFWCFLVHPQGQILRGDLPDPDDYMYLDQVLDWLKGQGWYDHIQHRLDPPGGGMIHFSRLPMIPMAALILLFEALGLPPHGAATLMAIFWPLVLFAFFFIAVRWAAQSLMPKDWSGFTAYVTLFATGVLAMFAPGHVDHHGLIVLLMALALGCGLRMMREPDNADWGLAAGFILALALVVALETLPWIIVMSAFIGLWAVIKGGSAARSGLAFGLALYIGSVLFLPIERPPSELLNPDVAAYSVVYVYFTGSIAAIFTAIALAARTHPASRWVLAIGVTAVTGAMFLLRFPDLMTGPWGGVNPALAELILDNVTEAAPFYKAEGTWLKTVAGMLSPLIALASCGYFLRHAKPKERWPLGLLTAMLATAFLLTLFYQYRFAGVLGLMIIIPLAMLVQRGWLWIAEHKRGRARVYAEIGLLLLAGPLPAVLMPALIDGRSVNTGVFLFPVHADGEARVCDMYGIERILRSPPLYAGRPRLIMNTMGFGPELLFRTPDEVVSAPYHEDVRGNLDAVRFFSTTDPARAASIARRRHVELVVSCKLIPGMYANLTAIKEALPDMAESANSSAQKGPPMILRLITGSHLPRWLKPVSSPLLGNYVVYEIDFQPREGRSPPGE
jgi:hypothetical protein